MSRLPRQRYFDEETDSFEAFDLVTEALEKIDSYDPSKENEEVLEEADGLLSQASKLDEGRRYLKAEYFRAMVNYLRGRNEDAIGQFQEIREASRDASFGDELTYNLAAAYSEGRRWADAIREFNEVIERKDADPGLRLVACAGLALTYAERLVEVKARLKRLNAQEGAEAKAEREKEEERVRKYSGMIDLMYESIKIELTSRDRKERLDRDMVKEAERILRKAYKNAEGDAAAESIELLSAEAPKKSRRLSARARRIILALLVAAILVAVVIVHLFVGWDYFF